MALSLVFSSLLWLLHFHFPLQTLVKKHLCSIYQGPERAQLRGSVQRWMGRVLTFRASWPRPMFTHCPSTPLPPPLWHGALTAHMSNRDNVPKPFLFPLLPMLSLLRKGFFSHGFNHKTIFPALFSHLKFSNKFPLVFSTIQCALGQTSSPWVLSASVRSGTSFLFLQTLSLETILGHLPFLLCIQGSAFRLPPTCSWFSPLSFPPPPSYLVLMAA